MTQQEIKEHKQELLEKIEFCENHIKELQDYCKHPNITEGRCSDCDKFLYPADTRVFNSATTLAEKLKL